MSYTPEDYAEASALLNALRRDGDDDSVVDDACAMLREAADKLEQSRWQPIETAPRDGAYILVTSPQVGGTWVAKYCGEYQSGYRPPNPWMVMLLNTNHCKHRGATRVPTHWMPLPEPPYGV